MATADNTNSFILVDDADLYFDGRLHAEAWTGIALVSIENKDKALIQASRMFNSYIKWVDTRPYPLPVDYVAVADDIIPPTFAVCADAVKWATCEMALVLLQEDTQVKDDMDGIAQIGLSGMTVQATGAGKKVIPDHVSRMLAGLGRVMGTGSSIELIRS